MKAPRVLNWWLLAATVVFTSATGCSATNPDPSPSSDGLSVAPLATGRLSTIATDRQEVLYGLEYDGHFARLNVDNVQPPVDDGFDWTRAGNSQVRVFGTMSSDGSIEATQIRPADDSAGLATVGQELVTSGTRRALFARVTFDGGQPLSTLDNVTSKAEDMKNKLAASSFGALTLNYDVVGPYNITFGACGDYGRWVTDVKAAATKAGVDLSKYSHIALVVPVNCGYGGMGEQPGSITWLAVIDTGAFMHEFGHNFGNYHASSRTCTTNGQPTPMSDTCTMDEYGDPFDCMGNTYSQREYNAGYKAQLGWIPSSRIATASGTQSYTLAPSNVSSTGIQLLNVSGTNGVIYHLEFRQPATADNVTSTNAVTGVSIRAQFTTASDASRMQILDMNPNTTTFDDAPLAVGKSYTFWGTNTQVTVVSTSSAGAVVKVTGASTAPVGPTPQELRASSSGKCLSIVGSNKTAQGSNTSQRTCAKASDQMWTATPQSDGSYTIVNNGSNLCLDLYGSNAADGARVTQWACNGGANQHWKLVKQSNGTLSIVNVSSNKCLDVMSWSTADDASIAQWTCNGGANQQFTQL